MTDNSSTTTECLCNGSGYFGVFSDKRKYKDQDMLQPPPKSTPGLEIVLSFSYKYEIWLLGMILQAISLLCLLATVCTFIIFRNLCRGRVVALLLNLCASIIGVEVVVFAAEVTTDSRLGCKVSNILRYYFIMVSLLWNGVEAYNMNLMLLKVFDQGVANFTMKAVIPSWGLPVLAIILILLVDNDAFDGIYIDCTFRCVLKEETIFYAYLLPIGLIMLHNFIVYAFVIRTMAVKFEIQTSKDETPTWKSLAGGMSLLALLGSAWIISAFGANDATKGNQRLKQTEAMFQAAFMGGVCLQGVFIFTFYCVCNEDVRRHWKQMMLFRSSSTKSPIPGTSSLAA